MEYQVQSQDSRELGLECEILDWTRNRVEGRLKIDQKPLHAAGKVGYSKTLRHNPKTSNSSRSSGLPHDRITSVLQGLSTS